MTVVVNRMPGGVTQLFNTETGRISYKCKAERALMLIEAFGGIVKFNKKDAMATVTGNLTNLESCEVIKKGDHGYKDALSIVIKAKKEFVKTKNDVAKKEIQELEEHLSSL